MSHQVSGWGFWSKFILIVMTLACSHVAKANLLSDDFNSATSEPNPVWRFYDPLNTSASKDPGESTLTFDGTNALIEVPNGLGHDLWRSLSKNKAPRLLQTALNTDFQFEVKFETAPNDSSQLQGIIIQESNNAFLRFDIFYNTSGVQLFVAYINSATNKSTLYASKALENSPNYRQVIRSGDDWTLRYSDDGITWKFVSFTKSIAVTEVGFFAGNARDNPDFLSSIDYFINLDAPIIDNDTWTPPTEENIPPPVIDTWYEYAQPTAQLGRPGTSQQLANILGNTSSNISLSSLSYTLNDGPAQPLSFGPDTRRLQRKGDFNIEIGYASLNVGLNVIEIIATDSNGQSSSEVLTINYEPGNMWPLPYTAAWGSLTDIQDVESIAHVVDGLWELTPKGIRTTQTGYDRSIAIGDSTWSSDYQVTVPVTFNSGFAGVGFGIGWQGHVGNRSPKIEWPLQSLAWIRGPIENASLEIITYGGLPTNTWENVVTPDPQQQVSISRNVTYILKSSSESLTNGMSRFNVKLWPQSEAEPADWNISAEIPTREGSVLLVAYQADVTFGNVSIEPLSGISLDITVPEISDIQVATTNSTATITWVTDEPSTSKIDYGVDNNYGSNVDDSTLATSHSLTLSGLSANTTYHYQATSSDSSNNDASSVGLTFTTDDNAPATDITPPVISNIQVSALTHTSATITWDTDEQSNSEIDYGLSTSFGSNLNVASQTIAHSLTLSSLMPDTNYHYQISATDAIDNNAISPDLVFTTDSEPSNPNSSPSSPSGLVSDAFNGNLNTTAWTFYDPVGDSTLATTNTHASISVPAGSKHDLWKNQLMAPRIRQAANDTDFELEVRFDSVLSTRYQIQGITVEQDNTNLLRFDFYSDGSVTRIFSASFVNGRPTVRNQAVISDGVPLYLRVTREGDQWTMSYSYDGSNWNDSMVFTHSLTVTSVGIFGGNAGSPIPAHTALIDYFMVDGIAPETGTNDDISPPEISNRQITFTDSTATITWDTNEPSTSRVDYGVDYGGVDYGTDINYGSNVNNSALVTSHNLNINGLSANTTYHYQVSSSDSSNNIANSEELSFTTENEPPQTNGWWDNNWNYRASITVNSGAYERSDRPVEVAFNFTNYISSGDLSTPLDLNSIRVHEVDVNGLILSESIPFQFDPADNYDDSSNAAGNLIFILSNNTTAQAERYYHIYFDVEGGGYTAPIFANRVNVTDNVSDEAQDAFLVSTDTADYYYQKQAGGFSSIVDNDGNDWLNYHPTGGSAGSYRGIPNLVPPRDGGHFHPGATSSISSLVHQGPLKATIRSKTTDGLWEVQWEFFPEFARMSVILAEKEFWFLYEGTPGGLLDSNDFVVRPNGTETSYTTRWKGDLAGEEWVYLYDNQVGRSIFLAHHNDDGAVDSYRQLNNLMTVFGFGRDGNTSLLQPQQFHQFTIGLTDSTDFASTSTTLLSSYKDISINISSIDQNTQ